jgi:hypothetical protein
MPFNNVEPTSVGFENYSAAFDIGVAEAIPVRGEPRCPPSIGLLHRRPSTGMGSGQRRKRRAARRRRRCRPSHGRLRTGDRVLRMACPRLADLSPEAGRGLVLRTSCPVRWHLGAGLCHRRDGVSRGIPARRPATVADRSHHLGDRRPDRSGYRHPAVRVGIRLAPQTRRHGGEPDARATVPPAAGPSAAPLARSSSLCSPFSVSWSRASS